MNVDINALFSLIVSAIGLVSTVAYVVNRMAKLELKVDTLWDALMRRAISEGVSKGMFTINSPIKVPAAVREWYKTMEADLRKFYDSVGVKLSERDLFIEIERKFGDRILKEVCIPYGLYSMSCVLAAIAVAKGKNADEIDVLPD